MLGARGVALGLGKINLSDLQGVPAGQRQALERLRRRDRMEADERRRDQPRVLIKKHVDKQTLWAVCRAVVFGSILLVLGIIMTVLGYFSEPLAATSIFNRTANATVRRVDEQKRAQYDSLAFIGPVVMAVGAFVLMVACVMTLESRDKHAQIVHEYPALSRTASRRSRRRPPSADEQNPLVSAKDADKATSNNCLQLPAEAPPQPPPPNNNNNSAAVVDRHYQTAALRAAPTAAASDALIGGSVNRCFVRTDTDSAHYTCTTPATTLTVFSRPDMTGKYPSTSCLDTLVRHSDPQALLRRFLDDQSRMAARIRRRRCDGSLTKQSNSMEVQGSERVVDPRRCALSEGMPIRHSIVAEVHRCPEEAAPASTAVSLLDLTDADAFGSPAAASPPLRPAHAALQESGYRSYYDEQDLSTGGSSDASFVTVADDFDPLSLPPSDTHETLKPPPPHAMQPLSPSLSRSFR